MKAMMQDYPLTLQHMLWRVEKLFGRKEIVTKREDGVHRYTYGDLAPRVHKLAHALQRLGVAPGDRVATLAWNNYRHMELYYAIPCMGAVLHTLNLRLPPQQLQFVIEDACDKVIVVDKSLLPVLDKIAGRLPTVERIIVMNDGGDLPAHALGDPLDADDGVDPGDERGPPISGVKADDARPEAVEGDGSGEQGLGEGGIVPVGGGKAEEHGQARAAAEQGMDTVAAQEGGGMMGGSVAVWGVGIGAAPGPDRSAVNDQVTRADDALAERLPDGEHEEGLAERAGRLHANANAGQARSQSDMAHGERRQSVYSSVPGLFTAPGLWWNRAYDACD